MKICASVQLDVIQKNILNENVRRSICNRVDVIGRLDNFLKMELEEDFIERVFIKIENSSSKIVRIAKILATLFLCVSLVGIPLVCFCHLTNQKIKSIINRYVNNLNLQTNQLNRQDRIFRELGLKSKELSGLELNDYYPEMDCILPNQMNNSIMKGNNFFRPFIAFKLFTKNDYEKFVVTIYQEDDDSFEWKWGTNKEDFKAAHFNFDNFNRDAGAILKEIINGRHPDIGLV